MAFELLALKARLMRSKAFSATAAVGCRAGGTRGAETKLGHIAFKVHSSRAAQARPKIGRAMLFAVAMASGA